MKILTIAYYELKKLARDWRLLLIILSQPIVIALVVGLIADHNASNINIGLVNANNNKYSVAFEDSLRKDDNLKIINYDSVNLNDIKAGKVRAFVTVNITDQYPVAGSVNVQNDPAGSVIELFIYKDVASAVSDVSKTMISDNTNLSIKNSPIASKQQLSLLLNNKETDPLALTSSDATPFKLHHYDYYTSAVMVLMILLVVLNISGISITTERVNGTFERLFVTPYTKLDIIFGKALAQTLIGTFIAFVGILSLHLMFSIALGSIWLVVLLNFLVVILSVTLGLLISSITYSVVESVELAMYAFFITVLTTAIFSPIESINKYLLYFIKISPLYYAVDASRRVNMDNAGWAQISTNVYILIGFFVLFLIMSIILLRREAK